MHVLCQEVVGAVQCGPGNLETQNLQCLEGDQVTM